MDDDPFNGLPIISKEDGLKMRTGKPAPADPDIESARAAMEDVEAFGAIPLDEAKAKLGIGTRAGNSAECQRPRRD